MGKVWVIGIAGGTASGKTTIVNRLKEYFKDDISLVGHDSYYLAHDDMPFEERCKLNYDHPDSFETERMIADIKKLKQGIPVDCRCMILPTTTGRRKRCASSPSR